MNNKPISPEEIEPLIDWTFRRIKEENAADRSLLNATDIDDAMMVLCGYTDHMDIVQYLRFKSLLVFYFG